MRNLEANPRVALHFDGDGGGGDIVVFTGSATIGADVPPADQSPEYLEKYDEHIARIGMTPESFAAGVQRAGAHPLHSRGRSLATAALRACEILRP